MTTVRVRGRQSPSFPKGALAMHGLISSDHSNKFRKIVALDLGKFNSVGCVHDAASGSQAFTTLATTPAAMHDLLAQHAADEPARVLVVFETCDVAGWVYDIAVALGLPVAIANPANEAWR